jgi:tRNA A-37 threonylcarbamoyl transferase component Bud32
MVASLSRVGPYSVLRPLGAGGMAETFVAERRGPGAFVQRVCLKRIRTDMANDPELVRQFMAEAAIAARLRHAAIASVLDFGEDQGVLYMAIELIDGTDLREVIHAAPLGLPASLVTYIAVELTNALATAHDAGVVHRDVSPSNVLVSRAGEVKLADFGIARADTTPSQTRTGIVRGKVPYMAPEYARTGRFDARADLFSLGVLLHECAYGERPFDGATDLETLERATRGERTPMPSRQEPLPEGFETIIEHLLHADPDQRFGTASAALEAMLSLPVDARARRELGARVTALRPIPIEQRDESFADTALAAPVRRDQATRTLASEPLAVPRRKLGPLLAISAAALALAAAIALWLRMPEPAADPANAAPVAAEAPKAEAPQPPAPPAAAPPATADPVLRPVQAAAPDPTAAKPEPEKMGWLDVTVMPFGAYYVNDVLFRAEQRTVKLPPGTHTVRAQEPGAITRRVQVRAGRRTRVTIE